MRAVLDPDVIISGLLSPRGAPAKILRAWLEGVFEIVVSPLLLAELERALAYPKLRGRVTATEAAQLLAILRREARQEIDRHPRRPFAREIPETTTSSRSLRAPGRGSSPVTATCSRSRHSYP